MLNSVVRDLRWAMRSLIRKPGFAALAILTLSVGIGANTAIFSIVNDVLLRQPPYPNPDRLAVLWGTAPQNDHTRISGPNFLDYRDQNHVFENMAAFVGAMFIVTDLPAPERVRTGLVTPDFFTVLGVHPALGRNFDPEESRKGRDNVVILSHKFWTKSLGADPNILGRSITLNSTRCAIVGVMAPAFEFNIRGYFDGDPGLWRPAVITRDNAERGNETLRVIGRLKPGAGVQQARLDMDAAAANVARQFPDSDANVGVRVVQLHDQMVGDLRPALLLLFVIVAFVLAIACVNVANLQLERANARQREIALRTALGAARADIVKQLLVESVLLALMSSVVGLFLAAGAINELKDFFPAAIRPGDHSILDYRILAFSVLLSIATGIITGLTPALWTASLSLVPSLKESGKGSTAGRGFGRFRDVLVISEFALSVVLLVSSGLLIRSFIRLLEISPGFEASHVLTFRVALPAHVYSDTARQLAFFERAVAEVGRLPGVLAVGGIDDLPLTADRDSGPFLIEGHAVPPLNELPEVQMRIVAADYFRALRVPVLSGRVFTEADSGRSAPVVLINRTMAHKYFPGEDPLSKHLRIGSPKDTSPWLTVVGVMGDERDIGIDVDPQPEIYVPYSQGPVPYLNVVARTAQDPASLEGPARQVIHDLDRGLPYVTPIAMTKLFDQAFAARRFTMSLATLFATIALLLAASGIYGVVSYSTAQRTREIGVRMAMGAQTGDVLRLILRQGAVLALSGIGAGLVAAFFSARAISKMVYGTSITDAATYSMVTALLLTVALFSSIIPARRAARLDPTEALRYE